MAEELKPCPFCGAPGEIEHGSDHHGAWFNLGCSRHWGHVCDPDHSNTCIAGRVFYTETDVSEASAIAAWNTRASVRAAAMSDLIAGDADLYDAPSDDLVERIMSALWPVLGGSHTDADVWQQINDAVRAAIEQGQYRSEQ